MTVKDKVDQAERWLDKIKNSYPNQTEVEDNLSAFLSSINSIPDHLLEDYNNKYNLGVSLTEDLYKNKFEDKAKSQKNVNAIAFIVWFKQKINIIELDPIGSILTQKRHLDIHRTTQKPNHFEATLSDIVEVSDSVSVREFPANMTAEEAMRILREEVGKEEKKNSETRNESQSGSSTVDLYFQDLININVRDACQHFLDLMKNMVSEAHIQFS